MAYDDKYYFGMARLIIKATPNTEVQIGGSNSYTGTTDDDGRLDIKVAGRDLYTIQVGNDTKDVYASYGACRVINF